MSPRADDTTADVGPLYQKVKRHILAKILAGELPVNARVPSENELVRAFNVSRMTANRALKELTAEGYLRRIAGVGTFVSEFKAQGQLLEVRNIADEVKARGHHYSCRILKNTREQALDDIAKRLALHPEETVFSTVIVHQEEGQPIQLEERYVNPKIAPDYDKVDFTATTPGHYLLRTVPLQEVEHLVRACMPDRFIGVNLRMEPNEPCLLVERQTWSDGQPVTVVRLYHPGTRFELSGRFRP